MFYLQSRKKLNHFILILLFIVFSLFLWLFTLSGIGQAQANPSIWLAIDEWNEKKNEAIVTIGANDVVGLYGAEFILNFDPKQLSVVDADPQVAETQIIAGTCAQDGEIHLVENKTGIIRYISTQLSGALSENNCIIAQIPFELLDERSSTVDLTIKEVILAGARGEIETNINTQSISLDLNSKEQLILQAMTSPSSSSFNFAIKHLEVTQAIQRQDNSMPMIAERPAIARVYLDIPDAEVTTEEIEKITGTLHAARNGKELPNSPIMPFDQQFMPDLIADTNQVEHSLNYQLPSSWLKAGELTLWAEVNPTQEIDESTYDDNISKSIILEFDDITPPEIMLIPITYMKNGNQDDTRKPTLHGSNYLGLGMLPHTYPLAHMKVDIHSDYTFRGDLAMAEGWFDLLHELAQVRLLEQPDEALAQSARTMPKYYGLAPLRDVYYGGIAYQPGAVAAGIVEQFDSAAHQIGYNLDLKQVGECGHFYDIDPDYPDKEGYIEHVGVDVYNQRLKSDLEHRDMMSTCWPKWISGYNYNTIATLLSETDPSIDGWPEWQNVLVTYRKLTGLFFDVEEFKESEEYKDAGLSASDSSISQPAWLISGRIEADGNSATLNHALQTSRNKVIHGPGSGAYRLELKNKAGETSFSYAFNPTKIAQVGKELPPSDFGFAVPFFEDITHIELWQGDKLLTEMEGQEAPMLNVKVEEGEREDEDKDEVMLISWQTDDSAKVILRYSADDGQNWRVLALGLTEKEAELNKQQLSGSQNGLLEVIATHPLRSTSERIELGKIENKAPRLEILAEDSSEEIIQRLAHQPLVLSAVATDLEDGALAPEALTWSLSPDAIEQTTGHTLILSDGLPVGDYTLTLSATDKDQNETNKKLILSISE